MLGECAADLRRKPGTTSRTEGRIPGLPRNQPWKNSSFHCGTTIKIPVRRNNPCLAAIRHERSFHPMVQLLADRHDHVRLAAARALGNLDDIRAIEPLTEACADENCFVRVMAREAITKILCGQPEPLYR